MNENIIVKSYIRKGLGNCINETDNLEGTAISSIRNSEITVGTKFQNTEVSDDSSAQAVQKGVTLEKNIALIGPGEIISLSPSAVLRTYPKHGEFEFPCNYMPYIEFAEPDIPWRYSPAAPNVLTAQDQKTKYQRLRPWLSLIICKPEECVITNKADGTSIVQIEENAYSSVFQNMVNKTWLWGHAQKDKSRIIAARKLEAETAYTAFLIPTFELGRLAGLGFRDTENENGSAEDSPLHIFTQTAAWEDEYEQQKNKPQPLAFPIYYSWKFITGDASFKVLAQRLRPIPKTNNLPKDIQVDVTRMGMGLDYKNTEISGQNNPRSVAGVPMAAMPVDYEIIDFPKNEENEPEKNIADSVDHLLSKAPVFTDNKKLMNEDFEDDDPMIVPPIYGADHIIAVKLNNNPGDDYKNPKWFYDLNAKITNRIAAGLGVNVIQRNQEMLVNRAWEQVEEVVRANQWLREQFLGNKNNNTIFKNRIKIDAGKNTQNLSDSEIEEITQQLLNLSAILETPLFDELAEGSKTIAEILEEYGFSKDFISPSMQRLLKVGAFNLENFVNPDKSVSNAQLLKTIAENHSIIFNIDERDGASYYKVENLLKKLKKELNEYVYDAVYSFLSTWHLAAHFWVQAFKNNNKDIDKTVFNEKFTKIKEKNYLSEEEKEQLNSILKKDPAPLEDDSGKGIPCPFKNFNEYYNCCFKEDMDFYYAIIKLHDSVIEFIKAYKNKPQTSPAPKENKKTDWAALRDAINEYLEKWRVQKDIDDAIDKYEGVSNVRLPLKLNEDLKKKLKTMQKPFLAYPYFAEPAFYYLRKESAKYILPAIEELPNDTISVFMDNKRFVESFICGMNTEMGKELFWREYPTDKRGSYFEKFWDTISSETYQGDVSEQYNWQNELGKNHIDKSPLIIFAVKGALVKRYPNAEVFLSQGILDKTGDTTKVVFKTNEDLQPPVIQPSIKAKINENTVIYGFKVSIDQLLGNKEVDFQSPVYMQYGGGMFLTFKERSLDLNFDHLKLESISTTEIDSSNMARAIAARPYIYAKHVSAFLCDPKK